MQRNSQAGFSRNRLLSSLTTEDFGMLRPDLERVPLTQGMVLEEPNQLIEHVYFPEPSVGSIVAIAGGEKLEVGIFGPEGMSGLAVVNGTDRCPHHSFIQVAGQGFRIRTGDLRRAIEASPSLHGVLLRYSQAHTVQIAFTALANGRYTIDERLARWLLMCHDRVDGNVIHLTHEFLALMLGVRRAGVTTALQILEGAKVINATRGRLEILSREALLENAGDSYGAPEAEYERLLRLN
jgi:CRP-like cAMP-binding protein